MIINQKTLCISIFGIWFLFLNSQAFSQSILTASNQPLLCHDNKRYVIPDQLYSMILTKAEVPAVLFPRDSNGKLNLQKAALDSSFPDKTLFPQAEKQLEAMRVKKLAIVNAINGVTWFPRTPPN